jgi:hypothetical protein
MLAAALAVERGWAVNIGVGACGGGDEAAAGPRAPLAREPGGGGAVKHRFVRNAHSGGLRPQPHA